MLVIGQYLYTSSKRSAARGSHDKPALGWLFRRKAKKSVAQMSRLSVADNKKEDIDVHNLPSSPSLNPAVSENSK
jgi:hypothetical protein